MVLLFVALTGLVGCSPGQPTPTPTIAPMWQAEVDKALADPTLTDFERQVLTHLPITDAEYQEAKDRLVKCMTDQGYIAKYDGDQLTASGGPLSDPQGDKMGAVELQCEVGSIRYIQSIYLGMRVNPSGTSREVAVRQCYEKHGVPDGSGLTDDQFAALINSDAYRFSSAQAAQCFFDPLDTGLSADAAVQMAGDRMATVTLSPSPSG